MTTAKEKKLLADAIAQRDLSVSVRVVGNKTPADKCGIIIEGNNKWLTIIQNASKKS